MFFLWVILFLPPEVGLNQHDLIQAASYIMLYSISQGHRPPIFGSAGLFNLTIDQSVDLFSLVLFLGFILFLLIGWFQIRDAQKLPFFSLRRQRIVAGWRLILLGLALGIFTGVLRLWGREAAYTIVPPTPSITPTPTVTATTTRTLIPTITWTPSITYTPTITATATITSTPEIPEAITVLFQETVTPDPQAALSPIQISRSLDRLNRPINPDTVFENPVNTLYGAFTYDHLQNGVRWTALWYRGTQVICVETQPWDGGTGGYGFTECRPQTGWLPGEYEIRMFLGERWMRTARFTILGEPPTATITPTLTRTPSQTPTP